MDGSNDDTWATALMSLAGVIVLVIGGVLTLVIWRGSFRQGLDGSRVVGAARSNAAATAATAALGTACAATAATPASAAAPATPATPATAATATAALGEPDGQIDFQPGSGALPADAEAVLGPIAEAARADAAKVVLISAYRSTGGAAARAEELVGKRAESVRHALEADGVAANRLVLDKPSPTAAEGDSLEARRVELRLR